eukprot:scaffold3961_cov127-Skeletonema_marinoi.AAC.6
MSQRSKIIVVMDSRMEREQLKTAVSSQRARYSIVSNTAVGYGSIGTGRTNCTHRIGVCGYT